MSPAQPLPRTPEPSSQSCVYMNILFINIIGHFFLKRKKNKTAKGMKKKKKRKKQRSRDAGLFHGVRGAQTPRGAGLSPQVLPASCPRAVLSLVHVLVPGLRGFPFPSFSCVCVCVRVRACVCVKSGDSQIIDDFRLQHILIFF